MSRLIYLAYPIDALGGSGRNGLAPLLKACERELGDEGLSTFDPGLAFHLGGEWPTEAIASVNRVAQGYACGTLAWLPEGIPSLGVPVEIDRALGLGQAVAIIHEGQRSVMLADWRQRGAWVGENRVEAVDWMIEHARPGAVASFREAMAEATQVRVQRLENELQSVRKPMVQLPTRAHTGDAGFDLYVSRSCGLDPGQFVDVHCDIAAELPDDMWGWIVGRSSTLRSKGLLVNQGIIDQGYRGELMVGVWNLGPKRVGIDVGERIAQLIPMPLLAEGLEMVWAEKLSEGARGANGFGSTGA